MNINGSPGRGSVGTDLNAIPSFAIEKIEVLRDGASAQYGSDAIAGVININVKKNTNKLDVNLFSGGNFSKGANDHSGGVDGGNYHSHEKTTTFTFYFCIFIILNFCFFSKF